MPKPFLLSRSSGLFVSFNVPLDLQAAVGRECLIRSMRGAAMGFDWPLRG